MSYIKLRVWSFFFIFLIWCNILYSFSDRTTAINLKTDILGRDLSAFYCWCVTISHLIVFPFTGYISISTILFHSSFNTVWSFFFLLGKKIPLRYLNFDILLRSTRGRLDHFIFFYFFILCCTYLYPYFCKTNPYWLLKTKKEKNVQLFLLNVQKNTPMNQISIFVFFRFGQQRAESIMQCIAILKV